MTQLPETSDSLLVKLRDPDDAAAWERFMAVYRPAVYRLARRRGLQHADADDLAQQVMTRVCRAIGQWHKDPSRGTFRNWLFCIARNTCVNLLSRRPHDAALGGTTVQEQLQQCAASDDMEQVIQDEHHRAIFRWAAEEVRAEFHNATWLAFWLTTVDGLSVDQAADQLGKSVGAVYASRSRIMRRIKEKVREFQQ